MLRNSRKIGHNGQRCQPRVDSGLISHFPSKIVAAGRRISFRDGRDVRGWVGSSGQHMLGSHEPSRSRWLAAGAAACHLTSSTDRARAL